MSWWTDNFGKNRDISGPIKEPVKPEVKPPPLEIPDPMPALRPADLPASNHYKSRDKGKMTAEYRYLKPLCELTGPMGAQAKRDASWLAQNRAAFEECVKPSRFNGMPWHALGIISVMEMGQHFRGTILNGDPWNAKTKHFPPGLGPWKSYLDAAQWALDYEAKDWRFNLATWQWNDVGAYFYYLESWNGHNARMSPQYELTTPKGASPYIYSGTQFYVKGKKVEDGPRDFEPELVSQQAGCMSIVKALEQIGERVFP